MATATKPTATKPADPKKPVTTTKPADPKKPEIKKLGAETKPPKPLKLKGVTIGSFALEQMKKGLDNKAVLDAVKAKFPDAKTGMASINWYRNKAVNEGVEGVRGSRAITSEALAVKKEKEKAEKAKAKEAAEKQKAKEAKEKAAAEKAAAKDAKVNASKKPTATSSALD